VQLLQQLAVGWTTKDQGLSPSKGKNFLSTMSSSLVLGPTQPPDQRVSGALSPRVKWPGQESDHTSLTNAEVKKTWSCTYTPPYTFIA
jgi:hypothetical protein